MTGRDIRRVLVLGAGVAGLSAARALARFGYEVVVLEARDRVGGRCWTVDRVDLGAQWIHSTEGNPVTTLTRELGLPTLFVGGDSTYLGGWEHLMLQSRPGTPATLEEKHRSILAADAVHDGLDAFRRHILNNGLADCSIQSAIARVTSGLSLAEGDQEAIDWHMALLVRDDCAADAEDLSFLWWDDGYEVYGYGDSVLMDGYGSLAARLATGLDVRLGQVVTHVTYLSQDTTSGVRVRTTTGAEFEGDAAIVTLPLGVLKSQDITFTPPLPARKRAAIARLGVALLDKVIVEFDVPFWPAEQYVFGCFTGAVDSRPTCIVNLSKTHGIATLVLIVGGALAAQVERWCEKELRDWTLTVLGDTFGDLPVAPRSIRRTRWCADPFARGSYSYIALGSTPADLDALAEPVQETLYFAGEATVRQHWATVHSAYVSGLREAARISGHTEILPPRHFTENRRWRDMMQRANRFFNMLGRALTRDDLEERLSVLRASSLFEMVPPADLEVLATMFDSRAYADGEAVCTLGDAATEMYVIVQGVGVVELPDRWNTRRLKRGDSFGEYGLFSSGTRSATVRAEGHLVALVLDYQRFHRFLLAFPASMAALLNGAVQRLIAQEAVASGKA